MKHPQPIVTNARTGRPLSNRNRARTGRVNRPMLLVALGLLAFWVLVGLTVLLLA